MSRLERDIVQQLTNLMTFRLLHEKLWVARVLNMTASTANKTQVFQETAVLALKLCLIRPTHSMH